MPGAAATVRPDVCSTVSTALQRRRRPRAGAPACLCAAPAPLLPPDAPWRPPCPSPRCSIALAAHPPPRLWIPAHLRVHASGFLSRAGTRTHAATPAHHCSEVNQSSLTIDSSCSARELTLWKARVGEDAVHHRQRFVQLPLHDQPARGLRQQHERGCAARSREQLSRSWILDSIATLWGTHT